MPKETIRQRVATTLRKYAQALSPVWNYGNSGNGWTTVLETTTGSWQQDVQVNQNSVTANWAVWSCASLITGDIAKMPVSLERKDPRGIWVPGEDWALLRKPNRYQTWVEFSQNWDYSQLFWGNTYVLKQRDRMGEIVALYILDPCRVTPLVSEDGGVYYQLSQDNLAQIDASVVVPAAEIIHDRYKTPWHPLIGVSPIYACGIAATQGLTIQDSSSKAFENMSRPSGVITAPGALPQAKATELASRWQTGFTGDNAGKVAVLSDGMTYNPLTLVSAADAQLIEQAKFSGEMICACFGVPPYKIGLGQMPTVGNTGILNQQYYDQTLQYIVTKKEARLTEGLELRQPNFRISIDEGALLRMDPAARFDSHSKAIGGGWKTPNEARIEENLPPLAGGDTAYMQEQNFALSALAKRDAKEDPFGMTPAPAPTPPAANDDSAEEATKAVVIEIQKRFAHG